MPDTLRSRIIKAGDDEPAEGPLPLYRAYLAAAREAILVAREMIRPMGISWNSEAGTELDGEPLRLWSYPEGEPLNQHPWIAGQVLARKNAAEILDTLLTDLVPQEQQDQGAALLPADPSAAVQIEPLPNVRPLWLYRPQHDYECQLNHCFYCGEDREGAHKGHVFATTSLCTCGLDQAVREAIVAAGRGDE